MEQSVKNHDLLYVINVLSVSIDALSKAGEKEAVKAVSAKMLQFVEKLV